MVGITIELTGRLKEKTLNREQTTTKPETVESPSDCRSGSILGSLPSPFYDRDGITIYHADCRVILPHLERFDAVVTDPPYGMGDKLTGGEGSRWRRHFKSESHGWDKERPTTDTIRQVVGMGQQAIVWGGQFFDLGPARCWLTWNKIIRNWSSSEHELAWTNLDKPNRAFDYSHGQLASEGKHWHPTQKPLPLMQWCIRLLDEPETVLDPFAGAGTTLVAAKLSGVRAVGVEANLEYCENAVKRLAQGVLF